jgi:hypothetical protein
MSLKRRPPLPPPQAAAECLAAMCPFSNDVKGLGSAPVGTEGSAMSAVSGAPTNRAGLHVTAVAWSATGQALAVAYGRCVYVCVHVRG